MAAPPSSAQVSVAWTEQPDAEAPLVSDAECPPPPQERRILRRVPIVIAVVGLVAVGALVGNHHASTLHGNTHGAVQLGTVGAMMDVVGSLAKGIRTAADMTDTVHGTYSNLTTMIHTLSNTSRGFGNLGSELVNEMKRPAQFRARIKQRLATMNATQKAAVIARLKKKFNITSFKNLTPTADLYDKNTCMPDEEMFGQLCYKKCSDLTGGKYPHRLSGWSCCVDKPPCKPHSLVNLCGGYSVSGDSTGNVCPHSQGACLMNEELFDGICYKRCAIISLNLLPYRLGAATCCKVKSRLAFLQLDACDTGSEYATGGAGGAGDVNVGELNAKSPHAPLKALTEV